MSYFPKPSLNENDLAIIERGATAAHSIEAGKYVSWHGRTGKAKAAILQGATLSESIKPKYTQLLSETSSSGTKTLPDSVANYDEVIVIGYNGTANSVVHTVIPSYLWINYYMVNSTVTSLEAYPNWNDSRSINFRPVSATTFNVTFGGGCSIEAIFGVKH